MAGREEEFSIIRPSLIRQLKSILDQYPDDGQILKELLQNAEDAGATTIKFLYDETNYDSSNLKEFQHPDLSNFQGPALYAFNDATFTNKDWLGIRMLQDSVKEKDPLKVGRFGLGFKSVFHMTDLPSVISKNKLAYIDPHEKYFTFDGEATTGYCWNIDERNREMNQYPSQFKPFKSIFGCNEENFKRGNYSGTLFRFPLRKIPSALSKTVYGSTKILNLFQSFKQDAHLLLIFLKNIKKIELCVRQNSTIRTIFQVNLDEETWKFKQAIKLNLVRNIDFLKTYRGTIETIDYESNAKNKQSYFITEKFSSKIQDEQLKDLLKNVGHKYIPIVGTAMPIVTSERDVTGQVFCFLPLPSEQKTVSGLPIHVNGHFAVSQNRRHLKWSSHPNQKLLKTDVDLLWNRYLLGQMLPQCYCTMILKAIESNKMGQLNVEDILSSLPDLRLVFDHWKIILQPFYQTLFKESFLFSEVLNGKWLHIKEAIFDCMKDESTVVLGVRRLLLDCQVPVVKAPEHILHALSTFYNNDLFMITPDLVRRVILKQKNFEQKFDCSSKLLVLKYVVKDHDYNSLINLPLLPLKNGSFTTFLPKSSQNQSIFLMEKNDPRKLFLGIDHLLVRDDIDTSLYEALKRICKEGSLQLTDCKKSNLSFLIKQVLLENNCVFRQEKQDILTLYQSVLNAEWFENLWKHLCREFSTDLSNFEKLPIILLESDDNSTRLLKLDAGPLTLLKSAMGITLPEKVLYFLEKSGLCILEGIPNFVASHPLMLGNYVKLPVFEDIMEALYSSSQSCDKNSWRDNIRENCTSEEREAFREWIVSNRTQKIQSKHIELLKNMPLFETVGNKPFVVTACEVSKAAPAEKLPIQMFSPHINVADKNASILARMCNVQVIQITDILVQLVLPAMSTNTYQPDEVEAFFLYIVQKFNEYSKSKEFCATLATVPCVKTDSQTFLTPSEAFDDSSETVRSIFALQKLFPIGLYAEDNSRSVLRRLGLKGEKNITAEDLLEAIYCVNQLLIEDESVKNKSNLTNNTVNEDLENSCTMKQDILNKAIAITLFLERNIKLSSNSCFKSSLSTLKKSRFIPICQLPPDNYPKSLKWKAEQDNYLSKPTEVYGRRWSRICGSVSNVTSKNLSTELEDNLGIEKEPPLHVVIKHLQNIKNCYISEEKVNYLPLIINVYEFIFSKPVEKLRKALEDLNFTQFLWSGDGFCSVDLMVLEKFQVTLEPFCFFCPSEMLKYIKILKELGVESKCSIKTLLKVQHRMSNKMKQCQDGQFDYKQNLQMTIDILNYMKDLEEAKGQLQKFILIPVNHQQGFQFFPIEETSYCDLDWLRQGFDMAIDEGDDIKLAHNLLPATTCEALNVPTLMSRMLDAEELCFTGFGQSEPLTTRLKALLDDYTDGLAVPKELIQNADDAGATVVKFLYDERENESYRQYLLDERMSECQGPAFWSYNNAKFSDNDFKAITQLGGATKLERTDKVGKFGLGFNAVYNLTDVPSCVSNDHLVIFDPHLKYLRKAVRDCTKPGIKIAIKNSRALLKKLPHQFHTYQDIFGCKICSEKSHKFSGTLFRLPLRTKLQAAQSEISSKFYDENQMRVLLNLLIDHAQSLLLFTQSVTKIELHHLKKDGTTEDISKIFEVSKSCKVILAPPPVDFNFSDDRELLRNVSSLLKNSADFLKNKRQSNLNNFQWSYILQMSFKSGLIYDGKQDENPSITDKEKEVEVNNSEASEENKTNDDSTNKTLKTNNNALLLNTKASADDFWLIRCGMGIEESLTLSLENTQYGFNSACSVAIALQKVESNFVPIALQNSQLFCFLPLPIHSKLPVQINALFSVQSNRRSLNYKTIDDKENIKVLWNELLLKDAVNRVYMKAIEDVRRLLPSEFSFELYSLWPSDVPHLPMYLEPLIQAFYNNVACLEKVPLLEKNGKTVYLNNSLFLVDELQKSEIIETACTSIIQTVLKDFHVVKLSVLLMKALRKTGKKYIIEERLITISKFFKEYFFENLGILEEEDIYTMICFALRLNDGEINALISAFACIPAGPNKILKKPCELINPTQELAKLYDESDNRFPNGKELNEAYSLGLLQKLGMRSNDISWEETIDRLKTVERIENEQHRMDRISSIISFLEMKLRRTYNPNNDVGLGFAMDAVQNIPFLIARKKPENYPLEWFITDEKSKLFTPEEIYEKEDEKRLGSVAPIVEESVGNLENFSTRLKSFLRLIKKKCSWELLQKQFENILHCSFDKLNEKERKELEICWLRTLRSLNQVYPNLNEEDKTKFEDYFINNVSVQQSIFVDNNLVNPCKVAMRLDKDCSPYLYRIPDGVKDCHSLLLLCGVRESFEIEDFANSLTELKNNSEDKPLCDKDLLVSLALTNSLSSLLEVSNKSLEEVEKTSGTIYVPDNEGILREGRSLVVNDCPWMKGINGSLAHPKLSHSTAAFLGVRTTRGEAVRRYAKSLPFGQKEKFTSSIKRLIRNIPKDERILYELVQNADDAKATEIQIVLDYRMHQSKLVFGDEWRKLQGPALMVFNNQQFTDKDLYGIQQFGEGSKLEDPDSFGQYGVGFSSVYHLTDVPVLLTSIECKKTLCVFDPHCRYIPGSTSSDPGLRFDDVASVQHDFPDVFAPFKLLDKENATIFRFPLRTADMARTSIISKVETTVEEVQTIIDRLKNIATDLLLFAKNLKKITFFDIAVSGYKTNEYIVKSFLSPEDERLRSDYYDKYHIGVADLKRNPSNINKIEVEHVCYSLMMKDSLEREQTWFVSQRFGFGTMVPQNIEEAFINGELKKIIPRGSLACLLKKTVRGELAVQSGNRKIFCFLPLPLSTSLPVHVNAHFVLEHENRLNLAKEGLGADWNQMLQRFVLAPSYIELISCLRMRGLGHTMSDNFALVVPGCSKALIESSMKAFYEFWPKASEDNILNELVTSFYELVKEEKSPFFPCVQIADDEPNQAPQQSFITWLPAVANSIGGKKAYFTHDSESLTSNEGVPSFFGRVRSLFKSADNAKVPKTKEQIMKDVLIDCGLRLVATPKFVLRHLQEVNADIDFYEPSGVLTFLFSYSSFTESCDIGATLPCPVNNTKFKDIETIKELSVYCSSAESFWYRLDCVPLLLTADNILRTFDSAKPVFIPTYMELLPGSKSMFIHPILWDAVYKSSPKNLPVIKPMSISFVADLLDLQLSKEKFCQVQDPVEWNDIPSKKWMTTLWNMIGEETLETMDQITAADINESGSTRKEIAMKKTISPLDYWALIPAEEGGKQILMQPSMAKNIAFDFRLDDTQGLSNALKKLNVPKLNSGVLKQNIEYVRSLIACEDDARNVLNIICERKDRISNLNQSDTNNLCSYFGRKKKDLFLEEDVERLRDLPIHLTAAGELVSLSDAFVYTLPSQVPSDDTEVFHSKTGTVFLKTNPDLEEFHKTIGVSELSDLDVYQNFILKNVEFLTDEGRMKHLNYLFNRIKNPEITDNDKSDLVKFLMDTPLFYHSEKESMQRVCEFYDEDVSIFKCLLSASSFLAYENLKPFSKSEWKEFLLLLGLKSENDIDEKMILGFARDIEEKFKNGENAEKASLTFWEYIYEKMNIDKVENIGSELSKIECVSTTPINNDFIDLLPIPSENKYSSLNKCLPVKFSDCCWTQASFVRNWANPIDTIEDKIRAKRLQISLNFQENPTCKMVVNHLLKLSNAVGNRQFSLSEKNHILKCVFRGCYSYLQEHLPNEADNEKLLKLLFENKIVFLETHVTKARCTCLGFNNVDDELNHFIHKIPPSFGEFLTFFEMLGATECPTPNQYSYGLNEIAKLELPLTPNEFKLALRATKGLLLSIKKGETELEEFHLPSEDMEMIPSNLLVFNDTPAFYNRINGCKEIKLLSDLTQVNLTLHQTLDLIKNVPVKVRPKLLSDRVREVLMEEERKTATKDSKLVKFLSNRLKSAKFHIAVERLIYHNSIQADSSRTNEILHNVDIMAVKRVRTQLMLDSKVVKGTEISKCCVWDSGMLYIENKEEFDKQTLIEIVHYLADTILEGVLGSSSLYLVSLLTAENDNEFEILLDALNIRVKQVDSSKTNSPSSKVHSKQEKFLMKKNDYSINESVVVNVDGEYMFGTVQNMSSDEVFVSVGEQTVCLKYSDLYFIDRL
ncbi:DgyrCDS12159 [Dimorphilus gyrociliatus]|uniref:DgyrCDS12159 n=1 Tax=Dimorphilus gyrociliatus TaxID=2664684 RepID=A0A7I8W7G9_9ANNE|nr:DgyrCDS12159 [Dimorphilus gyrociliatus]